jgi:hypothetical protein
VVEVWRLLKAPVDGAGILLWNANDGTLVWAGKRRGEVSGELGGLPMGEASPGDLRAALSNEGSRAALPKTEPSLGADDERTSLADAFPPLVAQIGFVSFAFSTDGPNALGPWAAKALKALPVELEEDAKLFEGRSAFAFDVPNTDAVPNAVMLAVEGNADGREAKPVIPNPNSG